jgi:hypothetical protein
MPAPVSTTSTRSRLPTVALPSPTDGATGAGRLGRPVSHWNQLWSVVCFTVLVSSVTDGDITCTFTCTEPPLGVNLMALDKTLRKTCGNESSYKTTDSMNDKNFINVGNIEEKRVRVGCGAMNIRTCPSFFLSASKTRSIRVSCTRTSSSHTRCTPFAIA